MTLKFDCTVLCVQCEQGARGNKTLHKHFMFGDINSCLQFQKAVLIHVPSSPRSNEKDTVFSKKFIDLTISASENWNK